MMRQGWPLPHIFTLACVYDSTAQNLLEAGQHDKSIVMQRKSAEVHWEAV